MSNSSDVKVSFVVTIFNIEDYVGACLSALLGQTLPEIEVVCIDDKSTDRSLTIIREWAKKDARVRVIENARNMKQAASRNIGIDHCKGEYVAFVDGDDWVDPNYAEELYSQSQAYDAQVLQSKITHYHEATKLRWQHPKFDRNDGCHVIEGTCQRYSVYDGSPSLHAYINLFIRRSFLLQNQLYFDSKHREDTLFTFRIALQNVQLLICLDTSYYYRRRPSSGMSSDISRERALGTITTISTMQKYFEKNPGESACREALYRRSEQLVTSLISNIQSSHVGYQAKCNLYAATLGKIGDGSITDEALKRCLAVALLKGCSGTINRRKLFDLLLNNEILTSNTSDEFAELASEYMSPVASRMILWTNNMRRKMRVIVRRFF